MTQTQGYRSIYFAFFAILFVLAFPLLIEIFFADHVREGEYNSRLGWALILMFLGLLTAKSSLIKILTIPFIIGGSIDIGYAISFGGVFTTATLEAVFNTDVAEALEYASSYASTTLALVLSIYWLGIILLIKKLHLNFNPSKTKTTFLVLGLILSLTASYRLTIMQKYHDTIPGVLGSLPSYYMGHISLQQEIELREKLIENTNITANIHLEEKAQNYIFLIGESINRNHMSVYGYHRETTPFLNQLVENSIVYKDVISSHAQTTASLRVALTAASAEQGNEYREALSIIDIANKAGYKTWWISNQQPMRATLASIAKQADETQFISNDYQGVENNRYDGFLLPYIEEALLDDSPHKVIFVHMMGSHAQYSNRYPEAFNYFNDNAVNAYRDNLGQGKIDSINQYDNSVRYTDSLVGQTVKLLDNSKAELKALTLLSDHGEEVYDKINVKGHSPDNVTANMLEIPLITWLSAEFIEQKRDVTNAMKNNQNQAFRLDNFFHFAADLIGIQSPKIKLDRSLASSQYTSNEERKVYNKSYEGSLRYRDKDRNKIETKQLVSKE
jgi:heptose-I-phosphate ethanolaminephosphotransferase